MIVRALRANWVIPLLIVIVASAAYQFIPDNKRTSVANVKTTPKPGTPTNNHQRNHAGYGHEYSHDSPDAIPTATPPTYAETGDLEANEQIDNTTDIARNAVRLPSEQIYNSEFRDSLIASIQNGIMTFSQRRDFYTALNHPYIPAADKKLLYKELMLAFQQRKITPEQMFGYAR